jgi:hypothetical protein
MNDFNRILMSHTMETHVHLYSQEFSPSTNPDPFTISVDESLWRLYFEGEETQGRLFLQISNEEGTLQWVAPAGDVLYKRMMSEEKADENHNIYMPLWMLDTAGFEGNGEILKCTLLSNDAFPQATKIVLRVIDSAFYTENLKEELEEALTKMGVLQKHTTIQIPILSLGNYPVELFISNLEPADCVLCDGEEVAVEFEEPVDQIPAPPPPRPPTPIPSSPVSLAEPMFPQVAPTGRQGFVPFQGEGYTLRGTNTQIPEWRKNLPPRRP